MPRPTRESMAVDTIADAIGERWLVREYRATAHGFDLAMGWPEDATGPGNPRVILTVALIEYLTETRLRDVDLPVCRSVIKRLRHDIGLRWNWDTWWAARADDLRAMKLAAFAAKHGCSTGAASQRRARLT